MIFGTGIGGNIIQGNHIGVGASGLDSVIGSEIGISLINAPANLIGGTLEVDRNVIWGSTGGINMIGAGATGNIIQGNYFGTDATGTNPIPGSGVAIGMLGAPANLIGGTSAGARNLINGNGIGMIGAGTTGNIIQGNYFGMDATGTNPIPGSEVAIAMLDAPANLIGGTSDGARNVINGKGIGMIGAGTTGNIIQGNYLGLDTTGTIPIPGSRSGVMLLNAPANLIGGTSDGARNVISGSTGPNITVVGPESTGNIIQGNYLGLDATGTNRTAVGGNNVGIFIDGAPANKIGGSEGGARNVISGHSVAEILVGGSGATSNVIQGNYLGVDATGSNPVPGSFVGIFISGATANLIGGLHPGDGNLIGGDSVAGIFLSSAGTSDNSIQGNFVGVNATGTNATLGNAIGIFVLSGASINKIGGANAGQGNLVAGNSIAQISIEGAGSSFNMVQGNFVGVDATGASVVAGGTGILIGGGASENFIGGSNAGERNIVGGGIQLTGDGTTQNIVQGNYVGVDALGLGPLPGGQVGISLTAGASGNGIGGPGSGDGNLIGGQSQAGIWISGIGTSQNLISGNRIGGVSFLDGTPEVGSAYGILIGSGASNNVIGSPLGIRARADMEPNANFIENNLFGLYILGADPGVPECSGNTIRGNRFRNNAAVGIDLGPGAGTSANDEGDSDTGPNELQNYPVLTTAESSGSSTFVTGTLNSLPSTSYVIDLYLSDAGDDHLTHHGGATYLLKAVTVMTDGAGNALFGVSIPNSPSSMGQFVTATATGPDGSTSEFSANFTVTDHTRPVVGITTPSHNSFIPTLTTISGTASDGGGSGIAGNSVNLTLFQVSSGKFWDGNSWISNPATISVPVIGTTWTFTGTLPDNANNGLSGQYTLSASTQDNSGNQSQDQSGVNNITFTVDTNPPAVTITSPANGSSITTASYAFTGTANDVGGILHVNGFIRRNSDNLYWTGSGWDTPPHNLVTLYNTSTHQWQFLGALPQPGSTLVNGSYTFIVSV